MDGMSMDGIEPNARAILAQSDADVFSLMRREAMRQETELCLIPSENYASVAVSAALASAFGNKYAEGYPHVWEDGQRLEKNGRYYRGQSVTNPLERLVIQRALELFAPDPSEYHANVQAHSGSPANLAVLSALLKPGEVFMGLSLTDGGHLTHGHSVSATARFFRSVQYTLGAQEVIDYGALETSAKACSPKLIFCGATAYSQIIDFERLGHLAKSVGAVLVADVSHIAGLCIGGEHPHPFPHADILTSTTHKILRGPRGAVIISKKRYGLDIDRAVFPGLQGGPHMNVIAALGIALKEALQPEYRTYVKQVVKNAKVLAAGLANEGFRIVSGSTENHLILMDVVGSDTSVAQSSGAKFAVRMERAGIVANKNTIPGDAKPWRPAGVRLGTPAVTTLGMQEEEMAQIARWLGELAKAPQGTAVEASIRAQVERLMRRFPTPVPLGY